jgi:anhydro-N-acetylmuramic acid kinase
MTKYLAIGLMSGTSLDGLDICACIFTFKNNKWQYEFIAGNTIEYAQEWKRKLSEAPTLSGIELAKLNVDFGNFLGEQTNKFIAANNLSVDLISSHGHTVFHQPQHGLSFQIGSGAAITAKTKTTVVCDFRTVDVALHGQGAPLVPAGEKFLFEDYDYLINLGGFANISINKEKNRAAFDICPANIVLNSLIGQINPNLSFDKDGEISRKGNINEDLLRALNALDYYRISSPKSLGKEWVDQHIFPLFKPSYALQDNLRTFTEHIAMQIANVLKNLPTGEVLITGGGAFNVFLMERLTNYTTHKIVIPTKETVNFKEAIIFAFLGILRIEHQPNALKEVTGADFDNIGGAVYRCLP